ncbi:hypothetical protein B0I37DRAFT_448668 [Chaetomium sp. MPI-CAGE-AT-0009]|nr:hypothetical protein B0I37DRAFT_448668 [Chaetomium sp. MPI-CAGE-AT-0009]
MPKQSANSHSASEQPAKRDFELCKVVFGAAISQILYARRAFPLDCFQLLPLDQVVSRSFDDIVASGFEIRGHDKEHLRDQGTTLFIRQGKRYGVNRFLGIMRDDIFPIIEAENLVKFRISYLRSTTWEENCLLEYYTVAFKYHDDGRYELDVWRAGTGKQHVANTDSQLWNLGDYLSRLPSQTGTGPLHWTLAFHATDRPDDPPIGVWKFDRTDFDDANFGLQQQHGYAYARITRLEIMPLTPTDIRDVVLETSPESEIDRLVDHDSQAGSLGRPALGQTTHTERKRKRTKVQNARNNQKPSPPTRRPGAEQLSPPLTLPSSRNASKDAVTDKRDAMEAVANQDDRLFQNTESTHVPGLRKGLATKRKPKPPLQIFENAASSLPPTQIISQSQSLSQRSQGTRDNRVRTLDAKSVGQEWIVEDELLSSDPFKWLDGISLSPEPIYAMQFPPAAVPALPTQLPDTQSRTCQTAPADESRGMLRLGPSSSDVGAYHGMGQWEPQASPPANMLGITISDDEEAVETALVGNTKTVPQRAGERDEHAGISYTFSPNTVARRTSLFYDIPGSSDGE